MDATSAGCVEAGLFLGLLKAQVADFDGFVGTQFEAEITFHASRGTAILQRDGSLCHFGGKLSLPAAEEHAVPLIVLRYREAGETLIGTVGGLEVEGKQSLFMIRLAGGGIDEHDTDRVTPRVAESIFSRRRGRGWFRSSGAGGFPPASRC